MPKVFAYTLLLVDTVQPSLSDLPPKIEIFNLKSAIPQLVSLCHVGGKGVLGGCGSQENVVAESAVFQGGGQAVDRRVHGIDLSVDEKVYCNHCQNPRFLPLRGI
jgi:hypothetical protein